MAKKKKDESPVGQCLERVEKHYKRPILKRARDASNPFMLRRPTYALSMDIATGGGFPAGGVSQIAAPAGVGKNSLCNQVIAGCQHIYGEEACVAWIWTEIAYDKRHARINGVVVPSSDYEIRLENLYRKKQGWSPLTKEQIAKRKIELGEFVIADEGSSAEKLQAAVELVRENRCQVIVVDSVAAVVSHEREKTDLDDEPQQSAEARLITEFQKKLWHGFGNSYDDELNLTTMLIINQVRAKRNRRSMFDRAWDVGGAYAVKHGKLIDIWLKPGNRIWRTPTGKESRKKSENYVLVGKDVGWMVEKGKAGCHEGPSGEIPYYFRHGFDIYHDLIVTAMDHDIIKIKTSKKKGEKEKSRFYVFTDQGDEFDRGDGGLDELKEQALLDREFFDFIYWTVMRKADIQCVHSL